VTRLAFIARAKQLGCSLDEIAALVQIWDGKQCGPVQHRLHDLVTQKINDAQRQIAELTAYSAQLHRRRWPTLAKSPPTARAAMPAPASPTRRWLPTALYG
jgi:DNA-binding transcriptional MerR regulator